MSVLPRASRPLLGANGPVQTAGAPSSALLPGRQSRVAPPPPRRTFLHREVCCTRAQEPPQSLPRVCRAPSPKTDGLTIARQTHSSQGLYVPWHRGRSETPIGHACNKPDVPWGLQQGREPMGLGKGTLVMAAAAAVLVNLGP